MTTKSMAMMRSMEPCIDIVQVHAGGSVTASHTQLLVNANTPGMTHKIITDDVYSDARWANVLLSASIDQTILGDIYRLGAEV